MKLLKKFKKPKQKLIRVRYPIYRPEPYVKTVLLQNGFSSLCRCFTDAMMSTLFIGKTYEIGKKDIVLPAGIPRFPAFVHSHKRNVISVPILTICLMFRKLSKNIFQSNTETSWVYMQFSPMTHAGFYSLSAQVAIFYYVGYEGHALALFELVVFLTRMNEYHWIFF